MVSVGWHSTSAAMPDFHARPLAVTQAVIHVGITDGMYICRSFLPAEKRYTFAISKTVSTLAADFAASKVVTAAGTAELDVSGFTGDYYVLVLSGTPMTGSTSTFTANKVWME